MFTMAKIMEMEQTERNNVALCLFNTFLVKVQKTPPFMLSLAKTGVEKT